MHGESLFGKNRPLEIRADALFQLTVGMSGERKKDKRFLTFITWVNIVSVLQECMEVIEGRWVVQL